MSRSRRKPQPNLPFAAAFALIQMLRDPGQRSEETFAAEQNDSALTKGRKNLSFPENPERFAGAYAPFETDYFKAALSKPLPKSVSGFNGMDCGGEHH